MSNTPNDDTVGGIYDLATGVYGGLENIMALLYSGNSYTNDELFTRLSDIAGGILSIQEQLADELMVDKEMKEIMLHQIDNKRTGLKTATVEVEERIAAALEAQTGSNSLRSMFK